jgi:hypothetical protein
MDKHYAYVISELAKKIPKDVADLTLRRQKGRMPTQAFSDFAIHREQGDWAEQIIMQSLQDNITGYRVIKYGRTDDIMAGEPGFPQFYNRYQRELDTIGKRPDLLLFSLRDYPDNQPSDISMEDVIKLSDVIRKALAAFEIRSSSFLSKEYASKVEKGKRGRKFLSFTVKIEDLISVIKWISEYGVPHFYVQVFFDTAYIIPFHEILGLIADRRSEGDRYTIERNEKNQRKTTIHIDLKEGFVLGDIVEPPQHYSAVKHLERGRLLHYVKFRGGKMRIHPESVSKLISIAEGLKAVQH